MTRIFLLAALFSTFLFGCDESIDKSLVQNAVKLESPYSDFALYRYHVESPMAFGSGFTVVKILPTDQKCDYTDRNFFRFGNDYPYAIKWKNKDTLLVKCLIDGAGLSDRQPIRTDMQKWEDWTFEIEYYSTFSTGTNGSYSIDSYKVNPHSLTFKSEKKSLLFLNDRLVMELDESKIFLTEVKVDTFQQKTGLSFGDYEFDMPKNYNQSDFYEFPPFLKTNP
ncbi:hypothetical protein [Hymenobacter actinosclerus]|uniref:Lipoprotein n=1 Tax=Hymenobacter actinosclerus TaxID=82805 RepID=A0A1I0FMD1_9BACT|nr:hypothetical protein [Hymenobacter actinosclerus]SET59285.1 hypothetical protein SAMN04487998_2328 [Hymenobacter actinosclerus]